MNVRNHQISLAHLLRNTTYFAELLPDYDWPKRMLELLRESIHLRKTQNTNFEDEENFKKRFEAMLQEYVVIDDEALPRRRRRTDRILSSLYKD